MCVQRSFAIFEGCYREDIDTMNGRPVSMILLSTRTYDVMSGEYAGLYEIHTAMRHDGQHAFHATIHEISEVCYVSLSAVTLLESLSR